MIEFEVKSRVMNIGKRKAQTLYYASPKSNQRLTNKMVVDRIVHETSLDVGTMTNAGMTVKHHYPYDHNMTLDANLQGVNEQLNDLEEYREEQQEAEYSGGMRR